MTTLTNKGYAILKEALGAEECQLLRKDMTAQAYLPKSPVQPPSFPIYRESPTKLYIPRFYGVETYGVPDAVKLPSGDAIDVPFVGALREYQDKIVDCYMQQSGAAVAVATASHADATPYGGGGLLEIPCGRGKTVIALKLIALLKKKTLVIVHKGFLLNQWLERIREFLPSCKVGRIQGQIIDIDGKDIVIGMLQSLSMKEYPESMFESFGLTVVDECHHISSEVFCRSLQKIITLHTLGLSATMERKDGLSHVFKMFLGPIVYSEQRENNDPVLVKGIEYISTDAEFNETVYDYRGNPAFSTMISKLCASSHRSEFILKVLQEELNIEPNQQVMILAHNRNVLTYLHQAIAHRKIADGSVGYYLGGMKEPALKQTETCKVIIATYAMAAEALDIKTLTTLIMATPKTDIVQAVGRILRVKHKRPMVVDIIDSHDMFKNQWAKRRKFYKMSNYEVQQTTSVVYGTPAQYAILKPQPQTKAKAKAKATAQLNFANAETVVVKSTCQVLL
jgi:superfamily II DNA or RNA helicase